MFKKLKEKLEEENKNAGSLNPFGTPSNPGIPNPGTPTTGIPTTGTPTTGTPTSIICTPKVSKATTSIINPNYVVTSPDLISPDVEVSTSDLPTSQVSTSSVPTSLASIPQVVPPSADLLLVDLTPTIPSIGVDAPAQLPIQTPILDQALSPKSTETKSTITDGVVDEVPFDSESLVRKHKKEMDELSMRVQELLQSNVTLRKDKETLTAKCNEHQVALKRMDSQIKTLLEEKSALDTKIKSFGAILAEKDAILSEKDAILTQKDAKIKELSDGRDAKLSERDAKIQNLQDEIQRLLVSVEEKDEENVSLSRKLLDQASEYEEKIKSLEHARKELKNQIAEKIDDTIPRSEHEGALAKLEEIIADKNKALKLQQQRISDLKKSIQKGDFPSSPIHGRLRGETNSVTDAKLTDAKLTDAKLMDANSCNDSRSKSPPATLLLAPENNGLDGGPFPHNQHLASGKNLAPNQHSTSRQNSVASHSDNCCHAQSNSVCLDINFEYLKNVIFKFITASDIESQKQLIKAISTLLRFDACQEASIRDCIEWKTSWLSALPVIGPNLAPHTHLRHEAPPSTSKR